MFAAIKTAAEMSALVPSFNFSDGINLRANAIGNCSEIIYAKLMCLDYPFLKKRVRRRTFAGKMSTRQLHERMMNWSAC